MREGIEIDWDLFDTWVYDKITSVYLQKKNWI